MEYSITDNDFYMVALQPPTYTIDDHGDNDDEEEKHNHNDEDDDLQLEHRFAVVSCLHNYYYLTASEPETQKQQKQQQQSPSPSEEENKKDWNHQHHGRVAPLLFGCATGAILFSLVILVVGTAYNQGHLPPITVAFALPCMMMSMMVVAHSLFQWFCCFPNVIMIAHENNNNKNNSNISSTSSKNNNDDIEMDRPTNSQRRRNRITNNNKGVIFYCWAGYITGHLLSLALLIFVRIHQQFISQGVGIALFCVIFIPIAGMAAVKRFRRRTTTVTQRRQQQALQTHHHPHEEDEEERQGFLKGSGDNGTTLPLVVIP